MIQEYLLLELAEKDSVEAYNPEDVNKQMLSVDNGSCLCVRFSCDGENEENAKMLSCVDEFVRSNFRVTVLEDGCSVYFNKKLYPLISGFEYRLRKLLYLTSAINYDEKTSANIADLESQDFGQIFTLLFIDVTFMGKVKEEVKTRNREMFSKADVIAAIESIDENTLWDALLGKDSVPTLRRRFNDVRVYRNDIMHSHHVGWKKYKDIEKLYRTITHEIDDALNEIEYTENKASNNPSFNETLNRMLRLQEALSVFADNFKEAFSTPHIDSSFVDVISNLGKSIAESPSQQFGKGLADQIISHPFLVQQNPKIIEMQQQMSKHQTGIDLNSIAKMHELFVRMQESINPQPGQHQDQKNDKKNDLEEGETQ